MSIIRKTGGLVKSGLKKGSRGSIVIGGMDAKDISEKKDLLQDLINEAKGKAEVEINSIKELATIEAEKIINEAQSQADEIEKSAYLKGYEAGKEEAILKTNAELSLLILEANNIIESIQREKEEALQDEEAKIYQTILLIARTLLKRDLQLSKETSLEFISHAIKKLEHKMNVNILCCSEVASKINELKSKLIESNPGLENLSIIGDSKLQPGDIILESNKERLDFRIETLLEELVKEVIQ